MCIYVCILDNLLIESLKGVNNLALKTEASLKVLKRQPQRSRLHDCKNVTKNITIDENITCLILLCNRWDM